MNWLNIAWSICAGLCFMLGLLHALIWVKERRNYSYLASSIMAMCAGANAVIELALQHAPSTHAYADLLKLEVMFVYVLLMALLWLVSMQLGTFQRWLAYVIVAMWSLALVFNFLSPGSLVYAQVTGISRSMTAWGEPYGVGYGPANPWNLLSNVAVLLIVIYVSILSVHAWRHGKQRRAITLGGSIVLFILVAGAHSMLVDNGILNTPYMISFAYLAIVMSMSYELVNQAIQVPALNRAVAINQKRWQDLLDNVQLAVIAVDNEGKISYANPYLQTLSGYSEAELIQHSAGKLLPDSEQALLHARLQKAMEEGPRPQSRWRIRCATGEERNLDWSSVRQFDDEGHVIGLVSVGVDMTDQLQAQRDLQHTQQEMERIMRANLLGELTSTIAHELNQPLAAILSNAQAARRMLRANKFKFDMMSDILDDIIKDDKRASEVVHGVRAMLHQVKVNRDKVNIADIVSEVMRVVKSEVDGNGTTVELAVAPSMPPVWANRIEIQQVLMNLIVNAMHIQRGMPQQEHSVCIQIRAGDGMVLFQIRDRGPGIKAEDIEKIFEPFFTTRREGLGMGLALSRRIVEAHGGRIWAENHPEGGAVFTFTLPELAQ